MQGQRLSKPQRGLLWCTYCKTLLPVDCFSYYYFSGNMKTGSKKCKKCIKQRNKIYFSNNLSKVTKNYKKEGKYYLQAKARGSVYRAIKRGEINKGGCVFNNGCNGIIEAHHKYGYDKENYLNIVWLCRRHHRLVDTGIIKLD